MTYASDVAERAERAWYRHEQADGDALESFTLGYTVAAREEPRHTLNASAKLAEALDCFNWLRADQPDMARIRRQWSVVKEWIGPYASVEMRNSIDYLEELIGMPEA